MATLKVAIAAELRGDLTPAQFLRRTLPEWLAMANELHRRWPLPAGVSPDDVLQELLMGWWMFRTGCGEAACWSAYRHAARWLHAQRAAKRRSWCEPGRFDVQQAGACSAVAADQELRAIAKQRAEQLLQRQKEPGRSGLSLVLRLEDFDMASEVMHADIDLRRRCRTEDAQEAKRFLVRAAKTALRGVETCL